MTTKTFSLEGFGRALIAGGVIVFSIRPPQKKGDGWAVNFRERRKETVWNHGEPKPTLEEAVMTTLEKIEALLANRTVSHVAFGRTTVPGPERFTSVEMAGGEFIRETGATVTESTDAAIAKIEKSRSKKAKVPETRYFIHPESASAFTTEDGTRPIGDGLVEEVDRETFLRCQAEWAPEADPLADLLG